MSHRRVKGIDYDEDDLDDYDEDDYGNEGEEEHMRLGTIKVREALGPDVALSDKQIQESLWHYYYDVAKTVVYLKNQQKSAQPKAQKQSSRFDQAAGAAGTKTAEPLKFPLPMFFAGPESPSFPKDFFKDTPWLNVPAHRRGKLDLESSASPGRLLGGSGKPSKLAALAAARKKKQEETKAGQTSTSVITPEPQGSGTAVSLLDRLGHKEKAEANTHDESAGAGQDKTSGDAVHEVKVTNQQTRSYPLRKKKEPSPVRQEQAPPIPEPEPHQDTEPQIPDLRAPPSTFASTVVGHREASPDAGGQLRARSVFPLPYTVEPDYTKANPFAGPSPDDVVMTAQAKGSKTQKAAAAKKANGTDASKLTEGVANLAVEEAPRVKSKNLDVLAEFEKSNIKPSANFVVIGHVDHGKSTLMGRLLYDLKVVDQRSLDKLQKEAHTIGKSSFALAWVMDETSEERSRGVTVDIATNTFETSKTRFTILDAPGHKDFVPNMIAGASQADFAVLVIDASTNSFESGLRGQTKEHALLARSIGVQRLIIAVNKMDTAAWSQERFDEIAQQMSAFLTTAGFQTKNLSFIPCAGLTGENIVEPIVDGKAPWYTGNTLIQELEASEPSKRALEKPLRMTISDVFRGGITNPLSISGRLDAGSLQVADRVLIMPSGESAVIKGIEIDSEPVDWCVAGQIATLHLTDIDAAHLRIGDIVCDARKPIQNVMTFTAKILAFEHVTPMYVDVLKGRLNVPARVSQLVGVLDKGSGEVLKKKPRIVKPGDVARVVVEMTRAVPLEAPGRVVLRAEGTTVAAGLLESAN
ncbi:elongation factor Tu GTP binding domain protein [Saccharata proteae CBS 121410]|uniref:Elongation factor 1 alpha-like protein n=1 Tax=Saccharata proteae CBS 121410 TaxID=1314787 RepID=A0A9P4I5U0_9PEZI|nr:elongation factor Tu GTP binding domain protein [Saccharata proteae CBS 121410]